MKEMYRYNVGDIVLVKSSSQVRAEGETDISNFGNGITEDNQIVEIVNYDQFTHKASGLTEDHPNPLIIVRFRSKYGNNLEYRRILASHIIEHFETKPIIKEDYNYLINFLKERSIT